MNQSAKPNAHSFPAGWTCTPRWTATIAVTLLVGLTATSQAQTSWQQQQYQAYQQQQMYDQQRRQQEAARQQQAYQETLRLQQQQNERQQAQRRAMEEEDYRRRQQQAYQQQEQERQKRAREQQYQSWGYVYEPNDVDPAAVDAPADNEPAEEPMDASAPDYAADDARATSATSSPWSTLFWVIVGAVAAAILLRPKGPTATDAATDASPIGAQVADAALHIAQAMGRRLRAQTFLLKRLARRSLRGSSHMLGQVMPSRQLLWAACSLALGGVLLILAAFAVVSVFSGFAFASSESIAWFVTLTLGYALVVSAARLIPWRSADDATPRVRVDIPSTADTYQVPISSIDGAELPLLPVVHLPIAATAQVGDHRPTNRSQAVSTSKISTAAKTSSVGSLRCDDCRKQYNVRGQGELAVRLVLCPTCGGELRKKGGESPTAGESMLNWTPIVSVFCEHCHGLIDVPYGCIGREIVCPRCDAQMLVPDKADCVKRLHSLGQLAAG